MTGAVEPDGWEIVDRTKFGTKYEHTDGATARSDYRRGSMALLINGDEVFEVTNLKSDRSEFWKKAEGALEGYPDNVDAHHRVGNAGLGDFGD